MNGGRMKTAEKSSAIVSDPNSSRKSANSAPARQHVALVLDVAVATVVAIILGAIEGTVVALRSGQGASFALIVSVYILTLPLIVGLCHLALRFTIGNRTRTRFHGWLSACLRGSRSQEERVLGLKRAIHVASALVFITLFCSSSIVVLWNLITHRHGAGLISVTFVTAQLFLAAASALAALTCRRVIARLFRALAGRADVERAWLLVMISVSVVVAGAGAYVFRQLLRESRGDRLSVALLAIVISLLIGGALALFPRFLLPRRATQRAWLAIVSIFALAAIGSGLAAAHLHNSLHDQAFLAPYWIDWIGRVSDLDGDGSPSFPFATDCAPFDANRHPLAVGIAGDGIDQNCDGRDESDSFALPTDLDENWSPPTTKPDLLLITVDSLRYDALGFGGAVREGISPRLDAFASRALHFSRAFSQDSGTAPSLWSLMTGKTPFQVKLENLSNRFPPSIAKTEVTLAEALQKRGYRTESVLCAKVFSTPHWNISRGFDRYQQLCSEQELQADAMAHSAKQALDELWGQPNPFFLWVHFYDPHAPYQKREGVDYGKQPRDLYDAEIHMTDRGVGALLDHIRRHARHGMVTAFTADHGENFGEHGDSHHARTLYREVTHVPLLLHREGIEPRRITSVVAINDIYATFTALAGTSDTQSTMQNLAPLLGAAEPDRARIVFQENSYSVPMRHAKAAIGFDHHLIYDMTHGNYELYNFERDPRETQNLYGRGNPAEERLRIALQDFVSTTKLPSWFPK